MWHIDDLNQRLYYRPSNILSIPASYLLQLKLNILKLVVSLDFGIFVQLYLKYVLLKKLLGLEEQFLKGVSSTWPERWYHRLSDWVTINAFEDGENPGVDAVLNDSKTLLYLLVQLVWKCNRLIFNNNYALLQVVEHFLELLGNLSKNSHLILHVADLFQLLGIEIAYGHLGVGEQ